MSSCTGRSPSRRLLDADDLRLFVELYRLCDARLLAHPATAAPLYIDGSNGTGRPPPTPRLKNGKSFIAEALPWLSDSSMSLGPGARAAMNMPSHRRIVPGLSFTPRLEEELVLVEGDLHERRDGRVIRRRRRCPRISTARSNSLSNGSSSSVSSPRTRTLSGRGTISATSPREKSVPFPLRILEDLLRPAWLGAHAHR